MKQIIVQISFEILISWCNKLMPSHQLNFTRRPSPLPGHSFCCTPSPPPSRRKRRKFSLSGSFTGDSPGYYVFFIIFPEYNWFMGQSCSMRRHWLRRASISANNVKERDCVEYFLMRIRLHLLEELARWSFHCHSLKLIFCREISVHFCELWSMEHISYLPE